MRTQQGHILQAASRRTAACAHGQGRKRGESPHQVGADWAHTTVDVKADAARGYHRLRIVHVKRCHITDGKPIAGVHIRQRNGALQAITRIMSGVRMMSRLR